jgi:hypothetical protein
MTDDRQIGYCVVDRELMLRLVTLVKERNTLKAL